MGTEAATDAQGDAARADARETTALAVTRPPATVARRSSRYERHMCGVLATLPVELHLRLQEEQRILGLAADTNTCVVNQARYGNARHF